MTYKIKCHNYELCEAMLPDWWFDCKGNYLCTNCDVMFGTWGEYTGRGNLMFKNKFKCPICFDIKRSVSYPNCNHYSCIDWFKRCYYGDDDYDNEPLFPYPNIENDYYDDQENSKWDIEYPLIKKYNKEWNRWDSRKMEKYDNESYLRRCPLCRK